MEKASGQGMAAEVEVLRGDRQAKGLRGGKGRSSEQSWGLQHAGVCALWEQMRLFLLTGCLRDRLGWKKKKDRGTVAWMQSVFRSSCVEAIVISVAVGNVEI